MPNWAEQFHRVEIDANHWAVLSQPREKIAGYLKFFSRRRLGSSMSSVDVVEKYNCVAEQGH